ncbi:MAG TPA: glycosyltransferase family 4 protein [Gaiellaceae bacterium]|jgi:glycosyltransferase involved in cell wall biosynthesis
MADLAVLGPDPAFGGGGAAQLEAFLEAVAALGRTAEVHHVPMPSRRRPVDAANQVAFGRKVAPLLRDAREVWVVATSASNGYGAALSGRPYSAWVGTGLEDEWAGRRPGLARSRRLAIRVNAPVLRRLEREVLAGARRVYATSPYSRGSVARAGGLEEPSVGILPLPVDLDRFTPAPDEAWQATLAEPVIVFVGRANDPRKNIRVLLDALPLLPGARILLVGEPPEGPLPPRVEATGSVESVVPSLHRGTLFVLPSHQEGFGIAAAEAMAAGLPVVTTPSGGPEALVRESRGGVVLSSFSTEELVATLRGLLDDPALLEDMRQSGREHVVREHSPERLRELLAEALDG